MNTSENAHNKENRLFMRRVIVAGLFVFLGMGVLIARYAFLQVSSHEKYATQSDTNRIKRISAPPSRGYIYDRNGLLLADNEPVFVAVMSPDQVKDPERSLRLVAPIFELTEEEITDVLARVEKSKNDPVTIKIDITAKQVAQFSERKPFFKGISVQNKLIRSYPYDDLFAHVIGYVGKINDRESKRLDKSLYAGTDLIGKLGIEKYYEEELLGKPGYRSVETNAHGDILRELETKAPIQGNDLYLTLDYGLQRVATNLLKQKGEKGSIIAIDPNNGDVLAFVSYPTYDPNLFVSGISFKNYGMLRDDKNLPLYNRALQGQYPPASTIKPMEGMGLLHYKYMDWDTTIFDPGYFSIPGDSHKFRDWKKSGHGTVNLKKSIVESVDTYYYMTAYRMGIKKLHAWMIRFGFGNKTGIDLPNEKKGIMPDATWKQNRYDKHWLPGDTISASIGQGYFLSTPLQVANATAMLANKGQRITPHVLKDYKGNMDIDLITEPNSKIDFNGTEEDWIKMADAMEATVRYGTARKIYTPAYRMAGKTGTAQVKSIAQGESYNAGTLPKKYWDHAWFTGFAPVGNPEIAVVVLVENGGGGSTAAAPIAKKVFDYWMLQKHTNPVLPPTTEEIEKIRVNAAANRARKVATWEIEKAKKDAEAAEKKAQKEAAAAEKRIETHLYRLQRQQMAQRGYKAPDALTRPINSKSLKQLIKEKSTLQLEIPTDNGTLNSNANIQIPLKPLELDP